jgi:hypothetical protein
MGASCVPVCSTNTKGFSSWGAAGDSKLLYRWIIGVVSPLLARARLLSLWLFVHHLIPVWSGMASFFFEYFYVFEWMNQCLTLPNGVSPPCRGWLGSASAMEQSALWRKNIVNFEVNKRWALGRLSLASILEMQSISRMTWDQAHLCSFVIWSDRVVFFFLSSDSFVVVANRLEIRISVGLTAPER